MEEELIEKLLYESEGPELDFKISQYPLTNNDEKSELIKDILIFANGWRRDDAYILIGVDEAKVAGRSTPVGITTHLSDSNLQQMVNSKTNHPVVFSYEAVSYKGLEIGLIKVPVQERPIFLTRDFGRLKKEVVYVRRGSATDIAGIDEVLKMKAGPSTPILDLRFADVISRQDMGDKIILTSEVVEYDEEKIPTLIFDVFSPNFIYANKDYKKEKALWIAETALLERLGFSLKNSASTLATNIRLELTTPRNPSVKAVDESDYPTQPSRNSFSGKPFYRPSNVLIDYHGKNLTIKVEFGSIQPGATVWSDRFFIGSTEPINLQLDGYLYGDNLPQPIPVTFNIEIQTNHRNLEPKELN
jgi:hypothetical protein